MCGTELPARCGDGFDEKEEEESNRVYQKIIVS